MNYEFHRRWAGFARNSALLKGRRPHNFGLVFGAGWGHRAPWVDCRRVHGCWGISSSRGMEYRSPLEWHQGPTMGRDEVLTILRAHYDDLREKFGVQSLRLFGSVARGEGQNG